jgi:hyaluronoglucosaminidase
MSTESQFRIGTVEGFFGRQWSWEARHDHAGFLAQQQFTTYLYAPKNDAYLRKQWFDLHPDTEFRELKSLAQHSAQCGIEFGVGLSPYELYRDFSASNRDKLKRKLDQLNQLDAPLLAVLFDDMLGDLPGLAATQLAIFDCIRQHSNATHFMLCPTYYSDDPLLVRHFGKQPERYLQELGDGLPASVDVFWTGPKVISDSYPRDHLLEVGARLQRKPLLWDNYPVNDAKRLTSFLHLLPFDHRDNGNFSLQTIVELCSGLLANPMNQAALSKIPLASLAQRFAETVGRPHANSAFSNSEVRRLLSEDAQRFQRSGVETMSAEERAVLIQRYQACLPDKMAKEVCEWLEGKYAFDPACLT